MTSIAISGSTGFLGRAVVETALTRGMTVIAIVRPTSRLDVLPESEHLHVVATNHYDSPETIEALHRQQPQAFIHLGWAGVGVGDRGASQVQQSNVATTVSTVDLAAATGCRFWLGIGSQAEYGRALAPDESTGTEPITEYGRAKVAACQAALASAASNGIAAGWARVYSVYGPGDREQAVLPYVIRTLLAGEVAVVGPCTHEWDLLHVDDAAAAILAIVDNELDGCTNVASGDARPLRESLEIAAHEIRGPGRIHFDYDRASSEPLVADVSRLQTCTGWRPAVPLEQGIAALVDHARRTAARALEGVAS